MKFPKFSKYVLGMVQVWSRYGLVLSGKFQDNVSILLHVCIEVKKWTKIERLNAAQFREFNAWLKERGW